MLYREIIAVCSQIHTKHINTLYGQNVEYVNVKTGGTYSDHWADTTEHRPLSNKPIIVNSSMSTIKFKCPFFFRESVQPATIVSQFDPVHTIKHHFLKAHFDILLSSTLWSPKYSLVFMCSERKCCWPTPLPSFPCVLVAAPIADSLMDHSTSRNHCDIIRRMRCSLCQSVPTAGNKKFHWNQRGFRLEDGNRFSVGNVRFCPAY